MFFFKTIYYDKDFNLMFKEKRNNNVFNYLNNLDKKKLYIYNFFLSKLSKNLHILNIFYNKKYF